MLIARKKYTGSLVALAEVLTRHFAVPSGFVYPEHRDAPLVPTDILRHRALLRDLWILSPTLSFNKLQLQQSLQEVARINEFTLPDVDVRDFWTTVAQRLLTLCQHSSSSIKPCRRQWPAWATAIFASDMSQPVAISVSPAVPPVPVSWETPAAALPSPPAPLADAAAVSYFVGWSTEHEAATRCDGADGEPELTTHIVESGGGDLEPAVAWWPDGFQAPLTHFTNVAGRSRGDMKAATAKPPPVAPYWTGTTPTGSELAVKLRKQNGRKDIVWLFLSGKCWWWVQIEGDTDEATLTRQHTGASMSLHSKQRAPC